MALHEESQKRPFEYLGISEPEERIYRWLLEHPGATVQKVARGLSQASSKVQRLLNAIVQAGDMVDTRSET